MRKATAVLIVFLAAMIALLGSCTQPQAPKSNLTANMSNGWQDLFAKDLSNCSYKPGSWTFDGRVLAWKGGGYIWTAERFGNFILDLDFKIAPKGNSGIFIRTDNIDDPVQTGIEIQMADSYGKKLGKHSCGAVYDCLAPSKNMAKKTGLWNHVTITCRDNKIYVVMNGQQIIDMDLNLWTKPHQNPDGTKNKFNTTYKDTPRQGHIGFQDHGKPIWYRNVKIKILPE